MAADSKLQETKLGEQKILRGTGGETHQVAGGNVETLTTAQGMPVSDDQNTLKAGERGPSRLEDQHFREKIFHFDHERIPERVVHARGYGAHGYFETYDSLSDITAAHLFQRADVADELDDGCRALSSADDARAFVEACRDVRYWKRQEMMAD